MITSREVAYGTYGAWRLAKCDSSGLQFFDNTPQAFWRSFYAALIVAPVFAILVAIRLEDVAVTGGTLHLLAIETLSYIIGWFAFPLAMFYIAEQLDRSHCFLRYIAAYNWATVLQMGLFLVVTVIAHSGALPTTLAVLISLAATVAILAYQWFIARIGLDITGPTAAAIVFLDLMIGIVLNIFTNGAL